MAKKDRDQIAALAAEGYSAGQVANRLGVSRNAVLGEAHRAGIKFGEPNPAEKKLIKPVTRAQLARACRWMRDHGATFAEIGEIFDRDVSHAFRLVNSVPEPEPEPKAPAAAQPPSAVAPQTSKWLRYAQQVAAGVEPEAWPA
jgi:hypothetical protein